MRPDGWKMLSHWACHEEFLVEFSVAIDLEVLFCECPLPFRAKRFVRLLHSDRVFKVNEQELVPGEVVAGTAQANL
eukprot:9971958-Prorocentrum_lima.AAC.1